MDRIGIMMRTGGVGLIGILMPTGGVDRMGIMMPTGGVYHLCWETWSGSVLTHSLKHLTVSPPSFLNHHI